MFSVTHNSKLYNILQLYYFHKQLSFTGGQPVILV